MLGNLRGPGFILYLPRFNMSMFRGRVSAWGPDMSLSFPESAAKGFFKRTCS